jgi:hypothetical protein
MFRQCCHQLLQSNKAAAASLIRKVEFITTDRKLSIIQNVNLQLPTLLKHQDHNTIKLATVLTPNTDQ